MLELLGPAAIGLGVGTVVGTLGGGGGVLTVPILVYLLGLTPHHAATGSLVIVGATSLVALVSHGRAGNVRWGQGLVFGLLGALCAYVGALLSATVTGAQLMASFAVLLLIVATLMVRKSVRPSPAFPRPAQARLSRGTRVRRLILVMAAASGTGLLTGFFGVGGGFVVVPALVLALGLGMRQAVGTSLVVITINSITGLAGRVEDLPSIDWPVIAAFAVASMAGGLLGSRVSARTRPATLQAAFAILLATAAIATAVQAVPDLMGP